MALTINTHPLKQQTNAPEFNVTTSLIESPSVQNVRVRATIYAGGYTEPIGVLEQAKGLSDWDFFSVLKNYIGRVDVDPGGSDLLITPSVSAELLTGWAVTNASWDTFTSSGRAITIGIGDDDVYAGSNDLGSVVKGDILVVGLEDDWADIDTGDVKLYYAESVGGGGLPVTPKIIQYAGLSSGKLQANNIYYFLVTEDSLTPHIYLGNAAGDIDVEGTLTVHKITDFRNNPALFFDVKFEEVYENVSNVTTIGAESFSDALLFFPVIVRPSEDFDEDFLAQDGSQDYLSRSKDNVKFILDNNVEFRYELAINTAVTIKAKCVIDTVSTVVSTASNTGWAILMVNETTAPGLNNTLDSFGAIIYNNATTWNQIITIEIEHKCYPAISAISFVGDLGPETLIFKGLPSEIGRSEKSFYKDVNRIRKVLAAHKSITKIIRSLYETEEIYRLMYELINAELDVYELDNSLIDHYREVTVMTDSSNIRDENNLFKNEIELEYYE